MMISVQDLNVVLGKFSLSRVNFNVAQGKYALLMGRTGSGKTTLLEAVCGLIPINSGRITLMGRDVTHLKPALRGVGFVPQEGALFSTMNVREHLGFALMVRKQKPDTINGRVDELAQQLGIEHLLERKPQGLSGGEKQRVALGRALAARPAVLCLDEPLSALDDETRHEICSLLKSIQKQENMTVLHITHNRNEAETLADHIYRMENGNLQKE